MLFLTGKTIINVSLAHPSTSASLWSYHVLLGILGEGSAFALFGRYSVGYYIASPSHLSPVETRLLPRVPL